MPGYKGALASVPRQRQADGISDFRLLLGKLRPCVPVPLCELINGPGQRFVEMAEIARIGASGGKLIRYVRTAHLVASNRSQDAVGRMRHVTVITFGPAGISAMVRMTDDSRRFA